MSGRELVVKVADLAVGVGDDVLITYGLGSCVAVVLHDATAGVGGLAHVLLPSLKLARSDAHPARAAETAIPALVEQMLGAGAVAFRLRARLVGGASMFAKLVPAGAIQMGERNAIACRLALRTHGIPVIGEAIGGQAGRTVRFQVATGRVEVSTVASGIQLL